MGGAMPAQKGIAAMVTSKVWWCMSIAFAAAGLLSVGCGSDLPHDHGVTWSCSGTVLETIDGFPDPIPLATYGGGCSSGDSLLSVTEFANPDVPEAQVEAACNGDCE